MEILFECLSGLVERRREIGVWSGRYGFEDSTTLQQFWAISRKCAPLGAKTS
jgi:hypothetical protein